MKGREGLLPNVSVYSHWMLWSMAWFWTASLDPVALNQTCAWNSEGSCYIIPQGLQLQINLSVWLGPLFVVENSPPCSPATIVWKPAKKKQTASLYNFKHLTRRSTLGAIIMAYSQSDASRRYCLEGAFISFWICKSKNCSEYFKVLLNASHYKPLERYFLTLAMNNAILVRDLIRICNATMQMYMDICSDPLSVHFIDAVSWRLESNSTYSITPGVF